LPYTVQIQIETTAETGEIKTAEQAIKALGQSSTQANQRMAQETERAAGRAAQAYEAHERSALKLRQAFIPLAGAVVQVTGALQQHNPAAAAAIQTVDNLVFSVAGAAAATGSFSAALTALTGPIGLVITVSTVLAGAISYFVTQSQTAKKTMEEWTQSMVGLQARLAVLQASNDAQRIAARGAIEYHTAVVAVKRAVDEGTISQEGANKRYRELAEIFPKITAAEQGATRQQNLDAVTAALVEQNNQLAVQFTRMTQGETAALAMAQAIEAEDFQRKAAGQTTQYTQAQLDTEIRRRTVLSQGILTQKDILEQLRRQDAITADQEAQLATVYDAQAKDRASLNQRNLDAIEIAQQLGLLEADRLAITGRQTDADRLRLQVQVQHLQQLRQIEEAEGMDVRIRDAQILNAQEQMQRLGAVTVNVGMEISRSLTDIFSAAVSGTLKLKDIGQSALAAVGRLAGETLSQFLNKKLGFENILLTNLKGLPGQASSAVAAGAATLPGGSTGGGIFSSLTGGGGGGGGGFLSSILPSGTSFGGLAAAGIGGFAGSSMLGGTGLQNIFSSIGSIGGSLLGATGIGSSMLTGIFDLLTAGGTGLLGFGGAGLAGIVGELLGDFLLPGIGSLIGFLLGGLFSQPINPTVWVRSKLEGIIYNELLNEFQPGSVRSRGTGKDIDSSTVTQVTSQVQQMLKGWSEQWADLLNIFPVFVHEKMIPTLADANKLLNQLFGKLKFSEGGSRTIQQEMADFSRTFGPRGFYTALRQTIGAGIAATLQAAGLGDLTAQVEAAFPATHPSSTLGIMLGQGAGLRSARKGEEFTQALAKFAAFTTSLATISTQGVTPFLTDQDRALLEDKLGSVLKQRKGDDFIKAVDKLDEQLSPVTEFLKKAVTESTNIFGRGLMSALDAASTSQALASFNQSIGEGAKQILFQGITEAFIASANFTDLMAPIQKIIREFTQTAIDTQTTPDLEAFRKAIFPAVEDISTRAELLAPLIAELQRLGLDIKTSLSSLFGGRGATSITINIGTVNNEQDARTIADRIFEHMEAALPPPS